MAVATSATAAAVDRKSVFRQALTALRYTVAGTVTVVVVMTAVYAFHVVARTDDLYIDVVNGYISLEDTENQQPPKLSFTLGIENPSGRVHFYYTDINCVVNVNNSRNSTYKKEFGFPDIVVAPDSVLQISKDDAYLNDTSSQQLIDDFKKNNSISLGANLTLTGNLTVGVYSVYNKTSVRTTYYCRTLTVGSVNGSNARSPTNCYTNTNEEEDIYWEQ